MVVMAAGKKRKSDADELREAFEEMRGALRQARGVGERLDGVDVRDGPHHLLDQRRLPLRGGDLLVRLAERVPHFRTGVLDSSVRGGERPGQIGAG